MILASRIGPTAVLAAARGSKKSAPFDRDRTSARAMKLTVGRSGGALRSCRWPAAVLISMAANLFTEGRPIASVVAPLWGRSSVGRALRSQCRGQWFDPPRFHHSPPLAENGQGRRPFWAASCGPSCGRRDGSPKLRIRFAGESQRAAFSPKAAQACHVMLIEFVVGGAFGAVNCATFSAEPPSIL